MQSNDIKCTYAIKYNKIQTKVIKNKRKQNLDKQKVQWRPFNAEKRQRFWASFVRQLIHKMQSNGRKCRKCHKIQ